jgi:hypothetical protein
MMQEALAFLMDRLLGSLPHLSALPLEPPHSLLLPLQIKHKCISMIYQDGIVEFHLFE